MNGYPVMPGVPSAGHVTRGGWWHPGREEICPKCSGRASGSTQRTSSERRNSLSPDTSLAAKLEAQRRARGLD
jgi:hypothetical protein